MSYAVRPLGFAEKETGRFDRTREPLTASEPLVQAGLGLHRPQAVVGGDEPDAVVGDDGRVGRRSAGAELPEDPRGSIMWRRHLTSTT
jgi:hypothetical protein